MLLVKDSRQAPQMVSSIGAPPYEQGPLTVPKRAPRCNGSKTDRPRCRKVPGLRACKTLAYVVCQCSGMCARSGQEDLSDGGAAGASTGEAGNDATMTKPQTSNPAP